MSPDELREKLVEEIIDCVRRDEDPSDEVGAKLLYFERDVVKRETAQLAARIVQLEAALLAAIPCLDTDRDLTDQDVQGTYPALIQRRAALRHCQAVIRK